MEFETLTPEEFSKFEKTQTVGNFFQSVERAKLREKMGFKSYLLGVKENRKVILAALLVEREKEAWIQLGPILNYNNLKLLDFFLENLKTFSKQNKFIKLEIFPPLVLSIRDIDGHVIKKHNLDRVFKLFKKHGFTHEGFTTKVENKANRWMFIKDLTGIKTLRDAELTMNSSTRKKLHKSKRELDLKILTDKKELKEWRQALVESDLKNHIKTRDLKYFEDLWDTFGENVIFIEARRKDNGELVSSEVDILHPNEMVAFLAGTIEKNKHFNGSTAIKGWNIEECLKRGQTRLNLYGMEGDFSPENPLLYFKGGLRGVVEEYIGGFSLVSNPFKLFLNKIRRKLRRFIS